MLRVGVVFLIAVIAQSNLLIDELAKRQKDILSVRANFTQEKKVKALKKPIRSKGVFYYKSPSFVRWQYEKTLTAIYDGKDLYLYYPELNEAEKIEGAAGFSLPLSFNISQMQRDYNLSTIEEPDIIKIKMTPKRQMPFLGVEMHIKKGEIFPSEVIIEEKTGEVTEIKFSSININIDMPEGLFTLSDNIKIRQRRLR